MITITRTASIAPGKMVDAMAFAHQVTRHIKEKHGVALQVLMPIGGNPSRIAWQSSHDSVAQWETLIGKLLGDKDYMDLVSRNSASFLAGSVHDEIWRQI